MKYSALITLVLLAGCNSCYKTPQAAWAACNAKYNGKCTFLGKPYKVCDSYYQSDKLFEHQSIPTPQEDYIEPDPDCDLDSGECDPNYDV